MKDTREIIEMLDTWEGLYYEHSVSELEDLLDVVETFRVKVIIHKRQEEKYA